MRLTDNIVTVDAVIATGVMKVGEFRISSPPSAQSTASGVCAYPPDPVATLRAFRTVVVTLEVFDTATERTVFTTPFVAVGFNPQPEPPEPAHTQE